MSVSNPITAEKLITAEELLRLPDDALRRELIRGRLVTMPPAGEPHGERTMRLGWRLAQHVEANDLGVVYAAETGFRLASDPDTVRGVDDHLAPLGGAPFVSKQRRQEIGEVEGYFPGAPDLAVEVISPNDTYTGVEERLQNTCRRAPERSGS